MNPQVVTIGLGYIGLPTSALIASKSTHVLGVDINQKIVREVINSIMCNYYLDLEIIAEKYNLDVNEIVNVVDFSKDKFQDFINDKLLIIENYKLIVFEKGRLFTRNIAMRFDPLVNQKIGTYSKTI